MNVDLSNDSRALGKKAAKQGAAEIRQAIAARGEARVILATGASQFDVLEALVNEPDIDWSKVTAFHLDEYMDLPETHKASFRGYLKARFVAKVENLGSFVFIEGDADDVDGEIARVSALIGTKNIDVAFVGIGENGHLAFNDPPADFETDAPYLVVDLDEACRAQQANEGWFGSIGEVPTRAITMSVRQIMASNVIICTVPDARKAGAVKNALEGPVSNLCPASILQNHQQTTVFLDRDSAGRLGEMPSGGAG